ncbi:hypothetical protein KBTX_02306 [wastewater metagenome]|uniref:Plasmid stabilization system protein n=2 Tax=unclassified sequences TaxID=12908 RepID=A0A5B8RGY8_9ZZZZ|nr:MULTISPECIES: type II toxin-antitoxin system RelE/ParE family toxin [Arhodomonas]QEA05977.1 hypothetical protein KBTEX_02306 [uncultured organism]
MRRVYAAEAIEDLSRLRAFIAEHDPNAAGRVAAELLERLETLPRFPRMGRPVAAAPEPETVRDMVFGRYVVRYSVHRETLVILRVWHELEGRGGS